MSIKEIHNALRSAEAMRKKLRDRRTSITQQMKILKRAGIVRGTVHNQEKRKGYFVWYLNVASSDCKAGERKRVYIGKDKDKLNEVHGKINRAAEYDKLGRELTSVEQAIRDFETSIRAAIEMTEYRSRQW